MHFKHVVWVLGLWRCMALPSIPVGNNSLAVQRLHQPAALRLPNGTPTDTTYCILHIIDYTFYMLFAWGGVFFTEAHAKENSGLHNLQGQWLVVRATQRCGTIHWIKAPPRSSLYKEFNRAATHPQLKSIQHPYGRIRIERIHTERVVEVEVIRRQDGILSGSHQATGWNPQTFRALLATSRRGVCLWRK